MNKHQRINHKRKTATEDIKTNKNIATKDIKMFKAPQQMSLKQTDKRLWNR